MAAIHNSFLNLEWDEKSCAWNLSSCGEEGGAALTGVRVGAAFRAGKKRVRWILREMEGEPVAAPRADPRHGRCRTLGLNADAGFGLAVRIEWKLPARRPFLLWRMILRNTGKERLYIDWIDLCLAGPRFGSTGGVQLPVGPEERTMFVNGWQSWSFAGGRKRGDRQPGPKLGPINAPMHVGTLRRPSGEPGHFVSDMFGVVGGGSGRDLLTAGFLSQREQFGLVETRLGEAILPLRMEADADGVRLDPGRMLQTDSAYLSLKAPASEYFDAAARENGARARKPAPDGWSSWYYYYTAVRQADVEKNAAAAAALRPRLPLKLIQLDDGYQARVGDWLERNEKFPSRMNVIAARIRKAGFIPGVWLSPFILNPDSRLAREHPDWIAPEAGGVMSNIKPSWVRETVPLDVTRPEVLGHVRRLIRTAVREWGFPFLKLDFLYLPAVKGARLSDPTVTRAQALRRALEAIREAAGGKAYLLGCGCPLGSGIGVFDAMRIGPDVDSIWKPHLFHRTWAGFGDPTLPAASNAVRNMFARAPLHRRWWWNDPDCLLARDAETHLTSPERRSLAAAIALSGGMVLLSDDLSALSPGSLRLTQVLFPPLHRAAEFPAWRGESPPSVAILPMRGPQGAWWVIGVFNWSDRTVKRSVDLGGLTGWRGESIIFSFWEERMLNATEGRLELTGIAPHGVVLLAVRPMKEGAQYAGSNLHFTQGAEVEKWKTSRGKVRMDLRLQRETEGAVWLVLPGEPLSALLDGRPIAPEDAGGGVWKCPIRFKRKGELEIHWK
jgi:alpha-galactosidase